MSTVFLKCARQDTWANAAHVMSVDEDNFAHMSNGDVIELDIGWFLLNKQHVFPHTTYIKGITELTCNLEKIVCLLDTHFNGHP